MAKIVHFEIPVDDPQRAVEFYREAFGWEVTSFGNEQYWLVRAGEEDEPGANGALVGRGAVHQSPVLIVGVENLDEVLTQVQRCGGKTIQGKLPIPGVGWSAYVFDPEGNTIGLFQEDTNAAGG